MLIWFLNTDNLTISYLQNLTIYDLKMKKVKEKLY